MPLFHALFWTFSYSYQKTINVGYIGAEGSKEIDVSDLSINLFLSYSGYIIRATNEVIPLPVYFEIIERGKLNSISWLRYYSDKLQFNVTGITNYAITEFYLTIQYTKRTI